MKVRCVSKGLEDHLTVGKVYDVIAELDSVPPGNTDYQLVGDDGQVDRFLKELFEPLKLAT